MTKARTLADNFAADINGITAGTGLTGGGTSGTVTLSIDSSVVTTTETQTLTNKTLTTPVIASISNSGTITVPTGTDTLVGRATTDTLTNKTLTTPTVNSGLLIGPEERWNIVASAATGTIPIDVLTSGVWYYTSNATANHTLNLRGSASTSMNTVLTTGDSITVLWLNTNGTTAYYPNVIQVDGSTVTPKWSGGTAPSAGNASSIDIYSFTVVKTANAAFTVFGAQVKYV